MFKPARSVRRLVVSLISFIAVGVTTGCYDTGPGSDAAWSPDTADTASEPEVDAGTPFDTSEPSDTSEPGDTREAGDPTDTLETDAPPDGQEDTSPRTDADTSPADSGEAGGSSPVERIFGAHKANSIEVSAAAADGSGAVYIAGSTPVSLDGQAQPGGNDAFVARYDAAGNQVWVRLVGTTGSAAPEDIALDDSGGVYLAGSTDEALGSATFAGGEDDAFVAKFHRDGTHRWTKHLGKAANDGAFAVATGPRGDVYVSGFIGKRSPEPFLAKFDSRGGQVWFRRRSTRGQQTVSDLAVDQAGNIYLAGTSEQPSSGDSQQTGVDAFVAKSDSQGNRIWMSRRGGAGWDDVEGLAVGSSGDVYVAGWTKAGMGGRTSNYHGGLDGFLLKVDSSGNHAWTRHIGTPEADWTFGVAIGARGEVHVGGQHRKRMAYFPDDSKEAFIATYKPSGTQSAKKTFRLSDSSSNRCNDFVLGSGNRAYLAGVAPGGLGGTTHVGLGGFVAAYDRTMASRDWGRTLGESYVEPAVAVTTDPTGRPVVTGQNIVVTLDGDLDILWAEELGDDSASGVEVTTDSNGDIYVAGLVNRAFAGEPYAGGKTDVFVQKFGGNGQQRWVRVFGSSGLDQVSDVTVGPSGGVYVSGATDTAPSGATYNGGREDALLAKFDRSGNRQWLRLLGTAGFDTGMGVAVDGAGEVYLAGHTKGRLTQNYLGGPADGFVAKYKSSGVNAWVRQIGTSGYDHFNTVSADRSSGVYVGGSVPSALDGQSYAGGSRDGFVARLDSTGSLQWARLVGSPKTDSAFDTTIDETTGDLFVTGSFGGPNSYNTGPSDRFVARFDPMGNRADLDVWGWPAPDDRNSGWSIAVGGPGRIYLVGK